MSHPQTPVVMWKFHHCLAHCGHMRHSCSAQVRRQLNQWFFIRYWIKNQLSLDFTRPPFPLGKLLLPVNQNSLTAFSTQWCTISPSPPLGFTKVMDFGNVCYLQLETSGLVSTPTDLGQSTQDRTHSEVSHQLLGPGFVPWTTTF